MVQRGTGEHRLGHLHGDTVIEGTGMAQRDPGSESVGPFDCFDFCSHPFSCCHGAPNVCFQRCWKLRGGGHQIMAAFLRQPTSNLTTNRHFINAILRTILRFYQVETHFAKDGEEEKRKKRADALDRARRRRNDAEDEERCRRGDEGDTKRRKRRRKKKRSPRGRGEED